MAHEISRIRTTLGTHTVHSSITRQFLQYVYEIDDRTTVDAVYNELANGSGSLSTGAHTFARSTDGIYTITTHQVVPDHQPLARYPSGHYPGCCH